MTSRRTICLVSLLAALAVGVFSSGPIHAQGVTAASSVVAQCPDESNPALTGLAGVVRDSAAGVIIPRARVTAVWQNENGERQSVVSESDENGVYYLCEIPASRSMAIQAMFATFATRPVEVTIEPGPPAGWDFEVPVRTGFLPGAFTTPGRIVGRVIDRRSARPVETATVELVGGDETRVTSGSGHFAFEDITPGVYNVRIQHLAYETTGQLINLPADRTVEVNFELTVDPIELEPLVVTAVREKRLEIRGFYDRKETGERLGQGVFVTREEIEKEMPLSVTHYLGRISGVRVVCTGSGRNSCTVFMRGGSPSLSSRAEVGCQNSNVYIDGVRVVRDNQTLQESIDYFVSPSDIAAMEVYRGPSEIPAEFGGSVGRCGAIVIWTGPSRP